MKVLMIEHFSTVSMYSTCLCDELGKLTELELLTCDSSQLEGKQNYQYWKCLYGSHQGENNLKRSILYLISLIKCFGKIVFGNYDVIHIQSFVKVGIESKLFKIFRNKNAKYIYTVHNILPHESSQKDRSNYGRIYEMSESLIVHNKASYKAFANIFPEYEGKLNIIPHGSYSYIKGKVNPVDKNNEKTCFFMLGLMRKYKGIDILLKAIAKLSDKDKNKCKVVIAGNLDPRLDNTDYMGMIEKLGLENIVEFIPEKISDEKMADYYNKSDACIFPYRSIYGSGALLMAYTFKKPVIASNIPSFIEETNNGATGLLFESENSKALADAMHQFIEMPKSTKKKFSDNIELLVKEKYNWKICAQKTLEIYNN